MLLLQIAELANTDIGKLSAQPLDDRADREQFLVGDIKQKFR
jgi:hypothetical protein